MPAKFYTSRQLHARAMELARTKLAELGGGKRVGNTQWGVAVTDTSATLGVEFAANLKDGNCGIYYASERL